MGKSFAKKDANCAISWKLRKWETYKNIILLKLATYPIWNGISCGNHWEWTGLADISKSEGIRSRSETEAGLNRTEKGANCGNNHQMKIHDKGRTIVGECETREVKELYSFNLFILD